MICKIWGIKTPPYASHTARGHCVSIINVYNYCNDDEKIYGSKDLSPFDMDEEILRINNSDSISSVYRYMNDPRKIERPFISGYRCNPDFIVEEFMMVKQENLSRVNKTIEDDTGNQCYHIIQSFPDDLDISDEEVHQCGLELAQKLKCYQVVVVSHLHSVIGSDGKDHGKQKHNHFIMNSHMLPEFIDPEHPEVMKYHDCKDTYAQLQRWNDEIALAHGFPIIVPEKDSVNYSQHRVAKANADNSWVLKMQYDIDAAIATSADWDSFKNTLAQEYNYQIREGKYLTFINPDGNYRIRDKRLGSNYFKENILKQLEENRLKEEAHQAEAARQEEEHRQAEEAQRMAELGLKPSLDSNIFSALVEINSTHKTTHKTALIKPSKKEAPLPTLPYKTLAQMVEDAPNQYHIEIPRQKQRFHGNPKHYLFKIHLKYQATPAVGCQYIKDDELYHIYDENHKSYGTSLGTDIKEILFSENMAHYLQFKTWEEEETRIEMYRALQVQLSHYKKDLQHIYAETQKTNGNKVPYYVRFNPDTGRRRSLEEELLILIYVLIYKEYPDFIKGSDYLNQKERAEKISLIISKKQHFKIKRCIEAAAIANKEQITDPAHLRKLLRDIGIECSKLQSKLEKLDPAQSAERTEIKANLDKARSRYTSLKKLEYQYKLAQNGKYRHGNFTDKVMERGIEKAIGKTSKGRSEAEIDR